MPTTRNLTDEALTQAVRDSFAGSGTDRFRELMSSLVAHVHAFAADVGLTEEEWFAAVDFLTRTGQISDARRQEVILLSDVLGLSMLVVGINHREPSAATESTVFGPFFVPGSPACANGDDIANGAPGEPCHVSGRVLDSDGRPVAGARVEVWQADEAGLYDVQYADLTEARGRAHLSAGDDGRFWFWTVKPVAYPIPDDGPVGELLAAAGRGPMRPAHLHFMVTAPGYRTVITHVFDGADEHLDSDAVFGVRSSLVGAFQRREPGEGPDGRRVEAPHWTLEYDLVLAPDRRARR